MKPPAGPMGDQMQRRNKTRISNIRNEVNEYVSKLKFTIDYMIY